MCKLTTKQRESLKGIFRQDHLGHTSYRTFRRSVFPMFLGRGCVMVPWCGQMIGIEPDGYIHS